MTEDRYSKENMLAFILMMSNMDPRPEHNLIYVKQQIKARKKAEEQARKKQEGK